MRHGVPTETLDANRDRPAEEIVAAEIRRLQAIEEPPGSEVPLDDEEADRASSVAAPAELFREVDLARLGEEAPAPQEWYWDRLAPAGQATLLGGHGEAGKTLLALTLAACSATGQKCLGRPTKLSRVLFFSGEDPAELILRRLDRICRSMDLGFDAVRERLRVIDATDFDPALFFERRVDGVRAGRTTPTYAALAAYIELHEIDLLIVDNASDTFDADEINRALVRAFIRALVRLVRPRNGAVVLLAHVDKGTSRAAGKGLTNSEGYSGNTAWHNSVRSRLFLLKRDTDVFELQHQKSNLGPKLEPMALEWHDGVLRLAGGAAEGGGMVQSIVDSNETRALLALLHEFAGRGEFVHTATNSPKSAAKLMAGEKTYPKRKPAEITDLLRGAERKRWISRESYRDAGRKSHERWVLTAEGCQHIGVAPSAPPSDAQGTLHVPGHGAPESEAQRGFAPSAPSAPSDAVGTESQPGVALARQVRHVHRGGCGGVARRTPESVEGDGS